MKKYETMITVVLKYGRYAEVEDNVSASEAEAKVFEMENKFLDKEIFPKVLGLVTSEVTVNTIGQED